MATKTAHADDKREHEEDLESIITKSFLNLEKLDVDLHRSRQLWRPRRGHAVFGGQVVGQALAAAAFSVPSDHHTHSLHCYFLRPGNVKQPILYSVDRTRDGRVYSSRNIKATQEGKAIFTMQASFKTGETDPFKHQFSMPAVPSPDQCDDMATWFQRTFGSRYPNKTRVMSDDDSKGQVDILRRPVQNYFTSGPLPARRCIWIKAVGRLGDDHKMHQCCAAYMSDMSLLDTSLLPYSQGMQGIFKFFLTSIDHSVWFHSEFRVDDWLLYDTECSVCGDGRAYVTGRMWTQDGCLVLSVAQGGVCRTMTEDSDPLKAKM